MGAPQTPPAPPPSPRTAALLAAAATITLAGAPRAADPTTGDCLAASEKSLTLRNQHKLRAARAQLLICASRSCPADIRKECTRRVDEVNGAMPTIVFGAKDGTGNDLAAVKVTMDGEIITEKVDGTAISLDPGAHTFTFQAAGQPILSRQIVIREGEKERREMLALGKPAEAPLAPVAAPARPEEASSPLGNQRVAALVVGSVGAVGLVVGGVFGGLSISQHNQAESVCPASGCPTQQGVDRWNAARLDGNVSTAALVVGGAALVVGVVLWLTGAPPAKPGDTPKPGIAELGMGPGSITLGGVW
jgi:hypothetical protein